MQQFTIDKERSEIRILLYKDKTLLSPLAHNHVIAAQNIQGNVQFNAENISETSLHVTIPVSSFIVDDPQRRAEEGSDFSSKLSDRDVKKTTEIMLDKSVLNAKNFPQILLECVAVSGNLPSVSVTLSVTVRGTAKEVSLPCQVEADGNQIHAVGELQLKQTDFGIKPVSVLLGSIKVQDPFKVKFDVYATV